MGQDIKKVALNSDETQELWVQKPHWFKRSGSTVGQVACKPFFPFCRMSLQPMECCCCCCFNNLIRLVLPLLSMLWESCAKSHLIYQYLGAFPVHFPLSNKHIQILKTQQQILTHQEMDKDLQQLVLKRNVQIHEKCTISLATREMQIKTTMRHHLHPVRWQKSTAEEQLHKDTIKREHW